MIMIGKKMNKNVSFEKRHQVHHHSSLPVIEISIKTDIKLVNPEELQKNEHRIFKWKIHVHLYKIDDHSVNHERKTNLDHQVKMITFRLHETFSNPIRVIKKPPFILKEKGWGEFIIPIAITFHNAKEFNINYPLLFSGDQPERKFQIPISYVEQGKENHKYDDQSVDETDSKKKSNKEEINLKKKDGEEKSGADPVGTATNIKRSNISTDVPFGSSISTIKTINQSPLSHYHSNDSLYFFQSGDPTIEKQSKSEISQKKEMVSPTISAQKEKGLEKLAFMLCHLQGTTLNKVLSTLRKWGIGIDSSLTEDKDREKDEIMEYNEKDLLKDDGDSNDFQNKRSNGMDHSTAISLSTVIENKRKSLSIEKEKDHVDIGDQINCDYDMYAKEKEKRNFLPHSTWLERDSLKITYHVYTFDLYELSKEKLKELCTILEDYQNPEK